MELAIMLGATIYSTSLNIFDMQEKNKLDPMMVFIQTATTISSVGLAYML